jgi:hypothetical protein
MKKSAALVYLSTALVLAIILLGFVSYFGVELLFGDKLGFWFPFFDDATFWEGFSARTGTQRYGLIYLLSSIGVYGFGWSVKADMLVNAFLFASMPFLFWLLIKKVWGKIVLSDLFVVFVLLSLAPVGTLFQNNFIHLILPLFCVAFIFLGLLKNNYLRLALGILVTFIAMYTMFAFIAVGVYLFLLVILPNKEINARFRFLEIALIAATTLACGYIIWFSSSEGTVALEIVSLFTWGHLAVLRDLFLNAFGLARVQHQLLFGAIIFSGIAVLVWKSGNRFTEISSAQKRFILQLALPVLAFIFLLSLGRVAFHPNAGLATRYYTTLCFLPLAIYFFARQEKKSLQITWVAIGVMMYFLPLPNAISQAKKYNQEASALKSCFEEAVTESDFENCIENADSGFYMPAIRGIAPAKLKQLKEEKKN